MEPSKMKSSVKIKRPQLQVDVGQTNFQQIIQLIEKLYSMRLIQKISRPMQYEQRNTLTDKFGKILELLHIKLLKIQNEINQKSNSDTTTRRSINEETSKLLDLKKQVRAVQRRYIQVFIEGSFKFYKKVAAVHQLNRRLDLIDIQAWSLKCLNLSQQSKKQMCCC